MPAPRTSAATTADGRTDDVATPLLQLKGSHEKLTSPVVSYPQEQPPPLWIPKLWFAQHILGFRRLQPFLPRGVRQYIDPLLLANDAQPLMTCNTSPPTAEEPPEELGSRDERHLRMRTGSDKHHIYVLDIKINTFCLYGVNNTWKCSDQLCRRALLNRFAHRSSTILSRDYTILIVYITSLRPDDVLSIWFPAVARLLMLTQIDVKILCEIAHKPQPPPEPREMIERRRSSIAQGFDYFGVILEESTFHASGIVNGLTAAMLVMKCYGDFRAMAKVFSYAPAQVAQEIRLYGLATAIGVQATSHLLGCIFDQWETNSYRVNQPSLLLAATHLLVAHIGRQDFHEYLVRAIPGTQDLVATRLQELLSREYAGNPLADFNLYCNMAALRDGVIWGAMRAYAKDVDTHNQADLAALQAFSSTATSLFSTAASMAPIGAGMAEAGVQNIGNWATLGINRWTSAHWVPGELDAALTARFDIEVTAPSKAANLDMPGLKQDIWRWKKRQQDASNSPHTQKVNPTEAQSMSPVGTVKEQTMARWQRWQARESQEKLMWKNTERETEQTPVSPENIKLIQDVYLANIGYVMNFCLNGAVTPRLSNLSIVNPKRYI